MAAIIALLAFIAGLTFGNQTPFQLGDVQEHGGAFLQYQGFFGTLIGAVITIIAISVARKTIDATILASQLQIDATREHQANQQNAIINRLRLRLKRSYWLANDFAETINWGVEEIKNDQFEIFNGMNFDPNTFPSDMDREEFMIQIPSDYQDLFEAAKNEFNSCPRICERINSILINDALKPHIKRRRMASNVRLLANRLKKFDDAMKALEVIPSVLPDANKYVADNFTELSKTIDTLSVYLANHENFRRQPSPVPENPA